MTGLVVALVIVSCLAALVTVCLVRAQGKLSRAEARAATFAWTHEAEEPGPEPAARDFGAECVPVVPASTEGGFRLRHSATGLEAEGTSAGSALLALEMAVWRHEQEQAR